MLESFGHRVANCNWGLPALGVGGSTMRLIPVSQDLLGLFDLFIRAGEVKFEFSGSPCDVNLDGGQPTPLHAQMELFVNFEYSMPLKTSHGQRVGWQQTESNGKRGVAVGWDESGLRQGEQVN